jgi:hypothetical protein
MVLSCRLRVLDCPLLAPFCAGMAAQDAACAVNNCRTTLTCRTCPAGQLLHRGVLGFSWCR